MENSTLPFANNQPDDVNNIYLRSTCNKDSCPCGKGLKFRSRISPSPKKKRLEKKYRLLEEQTSTFPEYQEGHSINPGDQESIEIGQFQSPSVYRELLCIPLQLSLIEEINSNNIQESPEKTETPTIRSQQNTGNLESTPVDNTYIPAEEFFSRAESKRDLDHQFASEATKRHRESTRRLSFLKPFSDYIPYSSDEELEEWWSQEKTDYTYSRSLSYRSEATPDKRVGSPNMSRRGLRTNSLINTKSEYIRDSISLRSRNINRQLNDSIDDSLNNSSVPSVGSEVQLMQQRLDYGLDNSDSESESFASTKRYKSPIVGKEGNPTWLVNKPNGSYKSTYTSDHRNVCTESITFQRKKANFPTYTADDDRPIKVFIKRSTERLLQLFFSLYSLISTVVVSSFRVLKNPIVAVASFQSWSSRKSPVAVRETNNHVNTTSLTTATYIRNYVSSTVTTTLAEYRRRRARSPLWWWWIPLLMLVLVPLLVTACWWQYGEHCFEKTVTLYSHMHLIKDRYPAKESHILTWMQSWLANCLWFAGQVVSSVWILLKEYLLLVGTGLGSYFTKTKSILAPDTMEFNEIRTSLRFLQEAENRQRNNLVKLEAKFQSEMSLAISKLVSEQQSQNENLILDLEKQKTSNLVKFELLSKSVRGLASSNHDQEAAEQTKLLMEQVSTLSYNVKRLNEDFINLKENYTDLQKTMKSCCNKSYVTTEDMERHVLFMTSQGMGSFNASLEEVKSWIRNYYLTKADLDERMSMAVRGYMSDLTEGNKLVMETLQQTANTVLQSSLNKIRSEFETLKNNVAHSSGIKDGYTSGSSSISSLCNQSKIESIVSAMLKKYDADRTGMVDYALESGGGSIVSTRCTESHKTDTVLLTIMGFSLWPVELNSPRSIIQPNRNPGNCWAFKGSLGFVVIKLSASIWLTGFTLEHIPKALSSRGNINSAPRAFSVYGLNTINGDGYKLGNYTFLDNGEPLQYFEVQNQNSFMFRFIELKINSNHGNMIFTCIYRFRVHGIPSSMEFT